MEPCLKTKHMSQEDRGEETGEGALEAACAQHRVGWRWAGAGAPQSLVKDSSQLLIECHMAPASLFPQGFNNVKIAIFIFE